jgi:hypothetical protein
VKRQTAFEDMESDKPGTIGPDVRLWLDFDQVNCGSRKRNQNLTLRELSVDTYVGSTIMLCWSKRNDEGTTTKEQRRPGEDVK